MNPIPDLAHAIALVMKEDDCDARTAARTLRDEAVDSDITLTQLANEIITTGRTTTGQEIKGLVEGRREAAALRKELPTLDDAAEQVRP